MVVKAVSPVSSSSSDVHRPLSLLGEDADPAMSDPGYDAIGQSIAAHRDWHIDTSEPQKSVVFLSVPRSGGQLSPVSGGSRRGAEFSTAFYALSGAIEAWRRKYMETQRGETGALVEPRSFAIVVHRVRCRVERVQDSRFHVRVPAALLELQHLGMPETLKNFLLSDELNLGGVVVVSGSDGCGKTTSINAVVRERVNRCGGYALMLGAPVEYAISGHYGTDSVPGLIEQVDLMGLDVTAEIRASMRAFPSGAVSILGFPELTASGGAGEMLRTANRGNLVFGDMHAKDVEAALLNLLSYANQDQEVYARELLGNSLRVLIHQTMAINAGGRRGVTVFYDYLRASRALLSALSDTSVPMSKVLQIVASETVTAAHPRR